MQGDGEFVHIRRALDRYFEVVATCKCRRQNGLELQPHVPHVESTFQKSVTGVNESHFFKHAQVAICVVKARPREPHDWPLRLCRDARHCSKTAGHLSRQLLKKEQKHLTTPHSITFPQYPKPPLINIATI